MAVWNVFIGCKIAVLPVHLSFHQGFAHTAALLYGTVARLSDEILLG